MELPLDLLDWLAKLSIITEYEVSEYGKSIVVLNKASTQQFELGLKFPLLIQYLQSLIVIR